jgi:hypothetical protein
LPAESPEYTEEISAIAVFSRTPEVGEARLSQNLPDNRRCGGSSGSSLTDVAYAKRGARPA